MNWRVNNMETPKLIFLSIAITIGLFLLLREVFSWYFKINKRIGLLLDIKDELIQANKYRNKGGDTLHSELISKNVAGTGNSGGRGNV
jgi:hypothetical protein